MKVIYIAGAYRSTLGEWHIRENIRRAEECALFVWGRGAVALCPHKNTAFFGGAPQTKDEMWLKGDMELLGRCDALYAVENWRISVGAVNEIDYARKHGMPVLFNKQEVIDYLNKDKE